MLKKSVSRTVQESNAARMDVAERAVSARAEPVKTTSVHVFHSVMEKRVARMVVAVSAEPARSERNAML